MSAKSLSPEFAVTGTVIEPAPAWEGEGGGKQDRSSSGVGRDRDSSGAGGKRNSSDGARKVSEDGHADSKAPAQEEGERGALMLRIEGMELPVATATPTSDPKNREGRGKGKTRAMKGEEGTTKDGVQQQQSLEQLIEQYETGLSQLRRVVDAEGGMVGG